MRPYGVPPNPPRRHIAYATQAVLNYWAFVDYLDESAGMSIGLNRYLVAKDKEGIRYCLVEEGVRLDKMSTKAWSKLVEHFRHGTHARARGGRHRVAHGLKPHPIPHRSIRKNHSLTPPPPRLMKSQRMSAQPSNGPKPIAISIPPTPSSSTPGTSTSKAAGSSPYLGSMANRTMHAAKLWGRCYMEKPVSDVARALKMHLVNTKTMKTILACVK